jgi:membrane protease YdiL (CAAX protease family)
VGTIVVGAGYFIVGTGVLLVGKVIEVVLGMSAPADPAQLFGNPVFGLVVVLLSITAVLPVVFGTAALVQRRRPGSLSSVAGRLRWTWLLRCLALAVLALVLGQAAQVVALSLAGEAYSDLFGWVGWQAFLPPLVAIVLLVPFQAATEEYMFRGWFIQAVGAHVRNPVWGVLIGALVFASLHGYSWVGLVDVFAFGAVMGWLAVRTGGLEAPIALHVMNNVLAFGLSAAAGNLEDALDQGKTPIPWQALAGTVVQLGVYAWGVLYLSKKRAIDTISA